jgi:hypothetical protein
MCVLVEFMGWPQKLVDELGELSNTPKNLALRVSQICE